MRHLWAGAMLLLGCTEGEDAPSCTIAGTYLVEGTVVTASEGCGQISAEAQASIPTGPRTYTISQKPVGLNGPDFLIEFQAATGACAMDQTASCSTQAKCNFQITDANDPSNAIGTKQLSLTFNASGFKGLQSDFTPPAKSLPKGCSSTLDVTGTRR